MPQTSSNDPVNHPKHYTDHPSGIECIQITEHMGFCLGNAIKYIWRADLKNDAIEDLKKAVWYIEREIKKRTKQGQDSSKWWESSKEYLDFLERLRGESNERKESKTVETGDETCGSGCNSKRVSCNKCKPV